jgi:phosphoribosyl-AMP cyclohydrolase
VATEGKIEDSLKLTPKFGRDGLITAVAQDAATGQVLMVAHMNQEALTETLRTGRAVYYSRSRGRLWRKGEESGHVQKVREVLVDCDQDCVLLKVLVDQGQCHAGYQSCFFRRVKEGTQDTLEFVAAKTYDPAVAYKKHDGR